MIALSSLRRKMDYMSCIAGSDRNIQHLSKNDGKFFEKIEVGSYDGIALEFRPVYLNYTVLAYLRPSKGPTLFHCLHVRVADHISVLRAPGICPSHVSTAVMWARSFLPVLLDGVMDSGV